MFNTVLPSIEEKEGFIFHVMEYISVKDESLGLETKGTETLGLVSVSYLILELV